MVGNHFDKIILNSVIVVFAVQAAINIFLCLAASPETNQISPELSNELVLTFDEKVAFDKFKAAVYSNITHEFMKQDLYLLRWIRAKDLDVERATKDAFDFLEFFRKNKIESILEEDWSDFEEEFPFYSDIQDKKGRPVAYGNVGTDWNVRVGMLQGKGPRLMRYTYKIVFELNDRLIQIERKQNNITQFVFLISLENFNLIQHACPMCISTYLNLLQNYERFLPGFAYEIVIINAPQRYMNVVNIIRQNLARETGKALKVYGGNKNQWKSHLDNLIDPSKLPMDFGGTKNSTK